MSEQQTESFNLARLIVERSELRDAIRTAGDAGDVQEVYRLLCRARDMELAFFAADYTNTRHTRVLQGRLGGYNPSLEAAERKLNELLARAGEPIPRDMWAHRG